MTVFITAGFSNLGLAISKAFYLKGYDVIVSSRTLKEHPYGRTVEMDLEDGESIKRASSQIKDLDVLVNNAGIFTEGNQINLDDEDFEKVFAVNMSGLFKVTKAFLPHLMKSNGSVVNISSMNAFHPGFNTSHYDASKGAVTAYTRSLAAETGLRVNAVAPGLISSERLQGSDLAQSFCNHSISSSMVNPSSIADLVFFLATSDGIYGQTIVIDNGYTLL